MPDSRTHSPTPSPRPPLHAFFNPSSVAIIGASADPHKLSHGILRNAVSHGYQGSVYPVNPRVQRILDLPCYPDISQVPGPVELAVLVLPASLCPGVVDACGRRDIKAVTVISGGFREVGDKGLALEQELVHIAHQYGIRLLGPNCVGTLDAYNGLNTTFLRTMPKPGPIAFVSQSGAICGGILEWVAGKGIGFSRFATLGNAADVSETDLVEALAEDPNTRVIVAYIEAIREGRRFIDVAGQVTPHKPILVIKAGRTQAGTRAVSSHTGSLAGSMAAYDAAFKQAGVLRVDTVEELFNHAQALAYGPLPRGPRVTVVTNAGGPASLAADELEQVGLALPPTPEDTCARLAQFTHPEAQLGNPVDLLGGAEPDQYQQAVQALLADDAYDAVLPILVPQALVDPVAVAEAIGQAAAGSLKPVVACFMGDVAVREPMAVLRRHRIASYVFPEQAARALGAMWRYAQLRARRTTDRPSPILRTGEPGLPVTDYRSPVTDHRSPITDHRSPLTLPPHRTHLGEHDCRPLLAAYGIPQPRAELARTADEAAQVAARIGFPVALKVASPDILHKSEVGGIALDLGDEAQVRQGFEAMLRRVRARRPAAAVEGALVAEMVQPGYELIVGMRRDPQFGPLMMFGLGGIYVELLRDVAFRIAPLGWEEAMGMIDETRAGRLLRGLRGQVPADLDEVTRVILQLAELALDHPQILEIDINPLIAYPQGPGQAVLAVDARMVLG